MLHWIFTIFVLLHGLVHLLYLAWAQGKLIPEDGFQWNSHSWLLSGWLGEQSATWVGMLLFGACALLFIVTAAGLAFRQAWAPNWLAISTIVSSITIVAMWDGRMQALSDKGFVGVLINVALLIGLYVFHYPAF